MTALLWILCGVAALLAATVIAALIARRRRIKRIGDAWLNAVGDTRPWESDR
jgi:cytochrome c-type biogenesis protein CcmH/NrfF